MAEKEYIEREKVLASISELTWYSKNKKGVLHIGAVNRKEAYYPACDVFDVIEKTPAADVVEVVHAQWKDNHCTVCGMMPMGEEIWDSCDFAPPKFEFFMDFCPNCGADMRERT